MKANAADLPHLEASRVKLDTFRERAEALYSEQSTFTAGKQEATKKLQEVLRAGNVLVDLLRTAAREHYGASSEKLVEFGVQPFRGRPRKAGPPPTEKPEPEPKPEPVETQSPADNVK